MKAIVVYESMFGNTHRVAQAIADGLGEVADVQLVHVPDARTLAFDDINLVVVGAPTHAHGLPSELSRKEAGRQAHQPDSGLTLEPDSAEYGVREWIESEPALPALYAAFDTRADSFKWLTGSAATTIAHQIRRHGRTQVVEPGSFLAPDNDTDLSEIDRAREWGASAGRAALELLGFPASAR